jgi:hypothetical protein
VDLEQREGRVHRYKGHAVRKNVVAAHGEEARAQMCQHIAARARASDGAPDPWFLLFKIATRQRAPGASELSPFWLFEGTAKVERRVPMIDFSSEHQRLRRLKRDLVTYRLAFGQPRQQELIDLARDGGLMAQDLAAVALDLRPTTNGQSLEGG